MIKQPELEKAIESLPSVARKELMDFLAYLQQKYRADAPIAKLGGAWAAIDFDVDDADVRELRQKVTKLFLSVPILTGDKVITASRHAKAIW